MVREEDFKKYNLLTLRDFARKIGVQSPTNKKKLQLIKEIVAIKNGLKAPKFSKLGRKPSESILSEAFNKCDFCPNKESVKIKEISASEFSSVLKSVIELLLSVY